VAWEFYNASGDLLDNFGTPFSSGGGGSFTCADLAACDTDGLAEGAVNKYFTDERAQDAVGGIFADDGDIDFTYDDATPKITAIVKTFHSFLLMGA
jgi:hypothetical protein